LLLHLRAEIVDGESDGIAAETQVKKKLGERAAFAMYSFLWRRPRLYSFGARLSRAFQNTIVKNGKARSGFSGLVPPLGAWTQWRDAPAIAPKTFREIWKEELSKRND